MTVKELKAELDYYDDDMDIVFEVCDDFEPYSVTEDRYGNRSVHIDEKVEPSFMSEMRGEMRIELSKRRAGEAE